MAIQHCEPTGSGWRSSVIVVTKAGSKSWPLVDCLQARQSLVELLLWASSVFCFMDYQNLPDLCGLQYWCIWNPGCGISVLHCTGLPSSSWNSCYGYNFISYCKSHNHFACPNVWFSLAAHRFSWWITDFPYGFFPCKWQPVSLPLSGFQNETLAKTHIWVT